MELLNAVLIVAGCKNSQQLRDLSSEEKIRLASSIEKRVPSALASIEEWNELLMTFMDAPIEGDKKTAKKKLLCYLRNEEYRETMPTKK